VKLRAARREERQVALLWGFVGLAGLAMRPFWLALAPLLPPCAFHRLTGIPCPTCGTTRAAVAFFHGDVLGAFAANPLAAAAAVLFVGGAVLAPLWAALNGPMLEIGHPLPRWVRGAVVAVVAAGWDYLIAARR
jgi:hypothetical protein